MKNIMIIALLFAGCHVNGCCGNGGANMAHLIDPDAQCWDIRDGDTDREDWSLCRSGNEDWLCNQNKGCRPLGDAIKFRRVP